MHKLIIRSGGQTGVDRAALDVARRRGISTSGWCPRGGWAEDHLEPPGLLREYPFLTETPSAEPEQRTAWNVRDSNATLILSPDNTAKSPGTKFTLVCANLVFMRPVLIVDPNDPRADETAADWISLLIRAHGSPALTLNVAGPRESESPGIAAKAQGLLGAILDRVQTRA